MDTQSDYEQYLRQQQAERKPSFNDMTLDERMTEYIEWQNTDFDRDLMIDAHLEIINLRAENARLRQILVDTCNATRGGCTTDVSDDFLAHLPGEAAAMTAENARLLAANEQAADELAVVMQQLREARHKLELENQANGDLFDVIAEIAAMFDIPRSAPYISRETTSAVAQMKQKLESADSEIKRLNDELATALNLPF